MWRHIKKSFEKTKRDELMLPFYVEFHGQTDGPTILITAGMDGDEYSSIQAAFELMESLKNCQFAGTVRIMPIINLAGFKQGISINPIDNKFPKYIFPGKKDGSSSEQLLFAVWNMVGKDVSLWLDLHGGARNEKLLPYILGCRTNNKTVDNRMKAYLQQLAYPRTLISTWDKCNEIAKMDCVYLLFEAGDRGIIDPSAVELHKRWVESLVKGYSNVTVDKKIKYFSKEHIYLCDRDCVFSPEELSESIEKNIVAGSLYSVEGEKIKDIIVKENCTFLYQRTYGWVQKGEILLRTASEFIEQNLE